MTCEVYGEVRHSGNDFLETHEEASYINNGFQQGNNNEWNNQSRPQGGNSNFNSNYNSNQPYLKGLNFNKMIEAKLAQIAAGIPVNNEGRSQGNRRILLKKLMR